MLETGEVRLATVNSLLYNISVNNEVDVTKFTGIPFNALKFERFFLTDTSKPTSVWYWRYLQESNASLIVTLRESMVQHKMLAYLT